MVDLRRSSRVNSIIFQLLIIFLTCRPCSKSPMPARSSKTRANAEGSPDPRRSGTVGPRWNTSLVELMMCRSASPLLPTAGYLYDYQQADEAAAWVHTQEARGERHEREEEDIGVKDSPSNMARVMTKTVERPTYPSPVPATTLTPGGMRHKLNPLSPSSGERP